MSSPPPRSFSWKSLNLIGDIEPEAVVDWVTSCRTSTLVERFKIHKHSSQERIMMPEEGLTLIFTFGNGRVVLKQ